MHLTEAEALLQLSNQESDEGIVSDQSSSADPEDATKRVKVRYLISRINILEYNSSATKMILSIFYKTFFISEQIFAKLSNF